MVRFETDRAVVRDVVEGDMDIMFSIYTQEKNMRYISGGRYDWTIFELRDKYSRINKSYSYGYGIFIVELKDSGEVIGEAGLFSFDRENRIFELGYVLAYIIHSGFISGYQNRYGDNLKPPTNVYHRMTA